MKRKNVLFSLFMFLLTAGPHSASHTPSPPVILPNTPGIETAQLCHAKGFDGIAFGRVWVGSRTVVSVLKRL